MSRKKGACPAGAQPLGGEGGFTLLELIVATAIFSVIITAAYGLFRASRTVQTRAEAQAELFQTARAALRAIEEDVRGAVMSGSAFDTGLIGTSRGAAQDKLEVFAVNQHAPGGKEPRIDLSKVTYWIADGSTKATGLVRERQRELTAQNIYSRRDENVEEIASEVVGLDLRYYDSGWKETWDSTQARKLPKAVEATVVIRTVWQDEEILERFTTRFYLVVGAEIPERPPQ